MNYFNTESMKINCCRPTFLSISTKPPKCVFVEVEVGQLRVLNPKISKFEVAKPIPFLLKLTLFISKMSSRDAFYLRKYQHCFVELHFSCQNVNFCFGARYDELEARNKNKPHQHLEIYPILFFANFETTF